MRKFLLPILLALISFASHAVPANPTPITITQPDGSTFNLRIVGDEHMSYETTVDGYSVLKNDAGYYVYATKVGDRVVPSNMVAHDMDKRNTSEQAFLHATAKHLVDEVITKAGEASRAKAFARYKSYLSGGNRYDYSNFRGLIVLVNFKDQKFSRSDVVDFYKHMTDDRNYTGYTNEDGSSDYYSRATGSVRDYFNDNSLGKFDPRFDVAGPVDMNEIVASSMRNSSHTVFRNVLQALEDSGFDFSPYTRDGKNVDMVYFIVAGWGSHANSSTYSGLLWPYASNFFGYSTNKGFSFGRYACSTEMAGRVGTSILDGIGVICHEFSHVLGLMDHYDTNYSKDGDQAHDPGTWDLMAGGSYHNTSRTPAGYNAFERYTVGWANPQVISEAGNYSLGAFASTNQAFILRNNPSSKEFFVIENRQQTDKWDAYLPGHGMLVFRVDSADSWYWQQNQVNTTNARMRFELLRAGNAQFSDNDYDPFPGTRTNSFLTNSSTPNLLTYQSIAPAATKSVESNFELNAIKEKDGIISFLVTQKGEALQKKVETFTTFLTNYDGEQYGEISNYTLNNCTATLDPDNDKEVYLSLKYPSQVTMTKDLDVPHAYLISVRAKNGTATSWTLKLEYSTDQGNTWTEATNVIGVKGVTAGGNSDQVLNFDVDIHQPARYRLTATKGSRSTLIVDDFTVYYDNSSGIEDLSVGTDFGVSVNGTIISVTTSGDQLVRLYNLEGQVVATAKVVDGVATLNAPAAGLYIVSQGNRADKILVR